MSHVLHDTLERVTGLELNLHQRFAAREHNRALRLLTRQRRHGVSGTVTASQEADREVCLGGLEVKYTSGSSVQVTPGAVTIFNPSRVTETRPGTYSPAPAEPDDDFFTMAVLPVATTVTPSPALGTTAGAEWWIVYATATNNTVESDSARSVFNESTGVFDATDADKVMQWVLTPAVVRGNPGDSVSTIAGALPSNSVMLAWIWVPSGATNLSNALIFDVRVLVDQSPGPNMCAARGRFGYDGTPDFTQAMSAPASNTETFSGHYWARIKGQMMSVVAPAGAGLSALKIKDPGATWDSGASLSTPKVAWLYLAAPGGFVPRLIAKGSSPIGNGAATNELVMMHGALVLSSRAPKGAVPSSGASVKASGLYDLRPSGALQMPVSYTIGGITYDFHGLTTSDAICLGPVLYNAYDSVNDCPVIAGPCHVSSDGWIGWTMGQIWAGFTPTDLITSVTTAGNGTDTITVTVTLATVGTGPAPITGVRLSTSMIGGYYSFFFEGKPHAGRRAVLDRYGTGSGTDQMIYWETEIEIAPQQVTAVAMGKGTDELYPSTITSPISHIQAIRWPYNEPLAT